MIPTGLRFFHISPDWCGAETLARLFRMNGHAVACHEDGRLAEDIAWAAATGAAPLTAWPRARLFAGLYRMAPWWRPPLEGWRSFAFLRDHFPQAKFILTTRDQDGWLLDRMTRDDGRAARAYAAHYGLDEADLPDRWVADWQDHLQQVANYFGDDPALIRVNLQKQTPDDLCRQLSGLLPMKHPPGRMRWQPADGLTLEQRLLRVMDRAPEAPHQQDDAFVEDVAAFCLRGLQPGGDADPAVGSGIYGIWDGGPTVRDKGPGLQPIRIGPQPGHPHDIAVSADTGPAKLRRVEGVINDILRLGRRDPVHVDMEDSRWMGSAHGPMPHRPVLCHNRREGARNVVLWPLPGQYGPGFPGFEATGCPDDIPFDDKADRLVWRGMISGGERLGDDQRTGPASHAFLRRLAAAGDDPVAREAAWQGLCRTSRMAVVRRLWGQSDYDLGVVMAWGFREFAKDPYLAPYCTPHQGPDFFQRFRYRLCMGGYDHGSNFMPSVHSQSVVLKEEDGWEVYYSGRFQPWKHYIPLQRYCDDLPEKLAWARENPNECKEMSRAARAEVRRLSDPVLTRAIMGRILDGLRAAE